MNKVVWSAGPRLACALTLVVATASCGSLTRQGQGSSYLIITSLKGANGAESSPKFGGSLNSDVTPVFNDLGEVTFQLGMKNPSITEPTSANAITIERYRVNYVRTDGHNIEGVDVPYAFDSGLTLTVSDSSTGTFTIVRHQAKEEAPLRALANKEAAPGTILSVIAEVTFYGHDQTGREASVMGKIGIAFADFANAK